jgi:hypothetical protein
LRLPRDEKRAKTKQEIAIENGTSPATITRRLAITPHLQVGTGRKGDPVRYYARGK